MVKRGRPLPGADRAGWWGESKGGEWGVGSGEQRAARGRPPWRAPCVAPPPTPPTSPSVSSAASCGGRLYANPPS